MRLETVFFIYRKLAKMNPDYCEKVMLQRDYDSDLIKNPMAITVKFIPKNDKRFNRNETKEIQRFCEYHRIKYEVGKKGEIEWKLGKMKNDGN
jgi:hypothetical protein